MALPFRVCLWANGKLKHCFKRHNCVSILKGRVSDLFRTPQIDGWCCLMSAFDRNRFGLMCIGFVCSCMAKNNWLFAGTVAPELWLKRGIEAFSA